MRGIAALAVLMFHMGTLHLGGGVFDRSYLAVDFFYILSGFVLVPSLEQGAGAKTGAGRLIARRVTRLWPMMAVGTMLGIALTTASDGALPSVALVLSGLMFAPLFDDNQPIFPLNAPQWSLLSELLANGAHVLVLRRLGLAVLVGLAGASWLTLTAMAHAHGSLNAGDRGLTWGQGLLRVSFGYIAGCVLARTHARWAPLAARHLRWWLAPSVFAALLVVPVLLVVPAASGDPLTVLGFIPVVAIAAAARIPDGLARTAAWLGRISFPLYALHFPVLRTAELLAARVPPAFGGMVFLAAATASIALAHIVSRSWLAKGIGAVPLPRWRPAAQAA
ncbi:acyltransferase family protein [Novosphingobium sp. KCTC 2891]|nr:acyltransferase family protein [Novosphingobium sp. KCTC 2891]